ncbi:hypothetical protein EJ04DRAFT_517298 [Polyplosphaeria fusca]|uniref:Cenp-O kinetochore centromere component n=1 Tax=Polyplosphaeria fusca TaxID=682080 RepID=A0A9P4QM56_9PLEO|nr:hypothetical protein EJ04DRAFT_517298 [Polyplosphaeria fusca]
MATMEALDDEILAIRAQIASLHAHRANLGSILLSSPNLPTRLEHRPVAKEGLRKKAAKIVKTQSNRNHENIYRACAGVTAYKVKDPDPNAVDNGNVLGVRIEVAVGGKFVDTYHVLLNRPYPTRKTVLKIHKHTIPPCIPLQQLATRFLPAPQKDAVTPTEQDLLKFGRCLRKELVAWHLRTNAVVKLRAEAGLPDEKDTRDVEMEKNPYGTVLNAFAGDSDEDSEDDGIDKTPPGPPRITDIGANTGVSEINFAWSNGQTGTMNVTKDGRIEKAVVRSKQGAHLVELSRRATGRIEGLVERLAS